MNSFHFSWTDLHIQLGLFGWELVICINDEPMFGVAHPDGRFFGFWTENFEFDRHPAPTPKELKERENALKSAEKNKTG
jgi:hypothetical protein